MEFQLRKNLIVFNLKPFSIIRNVNKCASPSVLFMLFKLSNSFLPTVFFELSNINYFEFLT